MILKTQLKIVFVWLFIITAITANGLWKQELFKWIEIRGFQCKNMYFVELNLFAFWDLHNHDWQYWKTQTWTPEVDFNEKYGDDKHC